GFALELGSGRVPLPSSAARLVALLAIHDRMLARPLVAGLLWPDTANPAATACLRTTVWRLGKVAPGVIAVTASHIRLASGVKTDIRDVREQLITTVYGETVDCGSREVPGGGQRIRPPQELSRWLSRELLPGWGDPWVVAERERLRQLSLHALDRLAAACLDAGAGGRALTLARAATELDPLRDSAQYLLV